MKKLEIFDPPLCCSSGVCGAEADEALIAFSANIHWLKQQGVSIQRYNLSQQPMAFADNMVVSAFLNRSGEKGLPLILFDGEIMLAGRYPERGELKRWCGISNSQNTGCC